MAKNILTVLICIFFALIIPLMILAIANSAFVVVYNKTNRAYFNLNTYITPNLHFSTLYHKNKKVDVILTYCDYERSHLFLGINGIYKICKFSFQEISIDALSEKEKELIKEMSKESSKKLNEYEKLLDEVGQGISYWDSLE